MTLRGRDMGPHVSDGNQRGCPTCRCWLPGDPGWETQHAPNNVAGDNTWLQPNNMVDDYDVVKPWIPMFKQGVQHVHPQPGIRLWR